ncbi:VIT1/CCC1 family protein [Cellulomonas sp. ES6]|uniref:VIT1/CCC1 transporter family protein n=1 Tax=Cellulomonas sp. ES6 TaxID=3039384 RepID=UPI0024B697B2|nr:VIT1/CCC1 family protein [Cellulomonas sp. ES6]WHP19448.1 VIT1/CCC1 family protein [Cellulomonas sp. ES6]
MRRWRRYLADERAEAAAYRDLASRRTGEERAILLALADAEKRHEQHWLDLLGDQVGRPLRGDYRSRVLGWLARRFGGVFVLALAQRAESRSAYADDADATPTMAADERIHEEVVRSLAMRGRNRISGTFRAAVFGANDGLVSNLALVLGIGASGVATSTVLLTGLAGLLAGALSMGAGEYVSVRSQRELLEASRPSRQAREALPHLDLDANELALVYRARGMTPDAARERAGTVLAGLAVLEGAAPASALTPGEGAVDEAADAGAGAGGEGAADAGAAGVAPAVPDVPAEVVDEHETVGSAVGAAGASFCFFATGALVPVVPYLLGMEGWPAVALASGLVGLALLGTGATVGVLSGSSPTKRALRQLAIGFGAAAATYLLGLAFGTSAA